MSKYQYRRSNPSKPSVVKEYGVWWARTRNAEGFQASLHKSQPEAFAAAQAMAGGDQ